MPFCHLRFTARIPPGKGYPLDLITLGDHLKKKRMDRGLRQKDAAREIGATQKTYENWEQDKYEPEFRFWPALIRFIGYDPRPEPATLALRIRDTRRKQGISQRELARRLELDPSTVAAWESGAVKKPYPRFTRLFEEYVAGV